MFTMVGTTYVYAVHHLHNMYIIPAVLICRPRIRGHAHTRWNESAGDQTKACFQDRRVDPWTAPARVGDGWVTGDGDCAYVWAGWK